MCAWVLHVYWVCVLPRHALEVHIECIVWCTHMQECVSNSWSHTGGKKEQLLILQEDEPLDAAGGVWAKHITMSELCVGVVEGACVSRRHLYQITTVCIL